MNFLESFLLAVKFMGFFGFGYAGFVILINTDFEFDDHPFLRTILGLFLIALSVALFIMMGTGGFE